MRKKAKLKKLNNSGAALVLVIVVIAFISISATILLYMTMMNFFMKSSDAKIKNNFYTAEKALEEIRATLLDKASIATVQAYDSVMANYGVSDPAAMQKEFNKAFISKMRSDWEAKVPTALADSTELYLRSMVDTSFKPDTYLSVDVTDIPSGCPYEFNAATGTFIIKNVQFSFTDDEGYTTIISTDYVVKAPTINFGMDPTAEAGKLGDTIEIVDCVTYNNWTKK